MEVSTKLERLLRAGYSPNGGDNLTFTPLHLAVLYGNFDMCRLLVHYEANINCTDEDGQTPLYSCLGIESSFDIFQFLLRSGARVDTQDVFERTPLHYAANSADKERVRLLLRLRGINVNAADYDGFTALHHVLSYCDLDVDIDDIRNIVHMLMDANADINTQDRRGQTPLHIAVSNDLHGISLIECLLLYSTKIDFTLRNSTDENIFHFLFDKAFYEQNEIQLLRDVVRGNIIQKEVLKKLLNEKDLKGLTPFCFVPVKSFLQRRHFLSFIGTRCRCKQCR